MLAVGLAVAALGIAGATAAVTLGRRAPATAGPAIVERRTTIEALATALRATTGVLRADDHGAVVVDDGTALGLERGDVVRAIGGRPTRDPGRGLVLLRRQAADAEALYFDIDRGGHPLIVRTAIDGDRAAVTIDDSPPAGLLDPAPTPGAPAPTAPAPADPALAAVLAGITRVDDTHVVITRAAVDDVLANPLPVAKGLRVVPSISNGRGDGLKLYAIRPGSLVAALGFQNGDTVHSVNGLALDSMDRALEAYTQLRSASHLELDLTRRGQPQTLVIDVR